VSNAKLLALPRRDAGQGRPIPAVAVPEGPSVQREFLGLMPLVSVIMAFGVLLVGIADRFARGGAAYAEPIFWVGVLVICAPPLARQLSRTAGRTERAALVVLLGAALYLVKVAASPYGFTFPDEMTHTYNVNQLIETGTLFHPNPLVDVTPYYPGLHAVTDALVSLSGLSVFQAGIAVVAVARVLLMIALFLLFEQLTRSSRVAGLAASLYAGHPNFAYYSAEFGYESLALPLALMVLFVASRRGAEESASRRTGWTLVAALGIVAVTITHHVTAFALLGTLVLATAFGLLRRRENRSAVPLDLAIFAAIALSVWLATVASPTMRYLSGVLTPALTQGLSALTRAQPTRLPFQSPSGLSTPPWQQAFALVWLAIVIFGIVYGLRQLRHARLRTPFAAIFILAAAAYAPIQGLRLTPAGWETANRSSEFLFLGVAPALAAALLAVCAKSGFRRLGGKVTLTATASIVVLGGMMTGWPYALQLPPPYLLTSAGGRLIEPEVISDARWALAVLGRDRVIAADATNAAVLAGYADQRAYTGSARGVQNLIQSRNFDPTIPEIVKAMNGEYVVVDRRIRSWDHQVGMFPTGGLGPLGSPSPEFDQQILAKFDRVARVHRVADSGNAVFYDVSGLAR
jgi:hypothetical protein